MKSTIRYRIKETRIQVIHDDGEIVVKNGVLIEGEQLCAIYDLDEEWFPFVCTLVEDLGHMLATQCLSMEVGGWEGECDEKMLYVCNGCHKIHADETHACQVCGCESLRIVPESELIN